MVRISLLFALLLSLLAVAAPTAHSGELENLPDAPTLRALLGRPANAEVLHELHPLALAGSPADRVRWAQALGRAGGVRTWPPLLRLLDDREPGVRAEAVAALAASGAWGGMVESQLLGLLRAELPGDRLAAARALAKVGTARSLPLLIETVRASDGELSTAALASLRRLTGEDRGANAGRWAAWWRLAGPRLHLRLDDALLVVMEAPETPAADRALHRAIGLAWADPDLLAEYCDAWLGSSNRALQRHAALVVRERPIPRLLEVVRKRAVRAREGSVAQRTLFETLRSLGMGTI